MKKLIATLIMTIFIAGAMNAQFNTAVVKEDDTYTSYTTDVDLEDADSVYWYIVAAKNFYTSQWVQIHIDTVNSSHSNIAVRFMGRYNANDDWATIGSVVNYTMNAADTTIEILNATGNGYRQFAVTVNPTGAGGESTIDWVRFKQWFDIP